jgi:hypothetical protein
MKVLTFLPRCDPQRRVEKGLSSAQFVVETAVSASSRAASGVLQKFRLALAW